MLSFDCTNQKFAWPNATASRFLLSVSSSRAFLTTSFQEPLRPRLLWREWADRGRCLALDWRTILAEFCRDVGGLESTSNSWADAPAPMMSNTTCVLLSITLWYPVHWFYFLKNIQCLKVQHFKILEQNPRETDTDLQHLLFISVVGKQCRTNHNRQQL